MEDTKILEVQDIRWEHIHMIVKIAGDDLSKYEYFIGNSKGDQRYPVELEKEELVINVVNIPEVKLLPKGRWYLFSREKGTELMIPMKVAADCAYRLENLDKIYRYSAKHCAYLVMFGVVSSEGLNKALTSFDGRFPDDMLGTGGIYLFIETEFMRENPGGPKRNPFVETKGFKSGLRGVAVRISKFVFNGLYRGLSAVRKHDGKNVLLMSETRIPIGGNLKALDDRLKERGLDKELHLSYSFSKTLEEGILKRGKNWMRLLWLIAGQDFIFVDDYVPIFQTIILRKETKLIQLWHAGVGFKSVGYSRFGRNASPHATDSCHRNYDYAIVGAKGLVPVYEEVFGIPKSQILPYGLPRLDGYLEPAKIESFRTSFYEQYPELKDKKIILFAPTFRGAGQKSAYYPWDKVDFDLAYQMCGQEYVFVIKMHPFVNKLAEIPEQYQDRIYDMSVGTDINELFYVTEILITDFSSNIYEFSLQDKPMIFYAFDKDHYQLTRGVHRTLDDFAPGKVCTTFEEVAAAIADHDFEEERRKKFIEESFDHQEGYASDRIIDEIILGKGAKAQADRT